MNAPSKKGPGPIGIFLSGLALLFQRAPHSWLRWGAFSLAVLAFDVLHIRRKVVLKNLAIVRKSRRVNLPRPSSTARFSYQSFFLTIFEFLGSKRLFPRAHIQIHNREYLDDALKKGVGAFILVIHQGNWELLCYAGTREFAPVFVPVKPVGKGSVARWVNAVRAANGLHEVLGNAGEVMRAIKLLKALKAGNLVGFMVDQRKSSGRSVPLFDVPAQTNVSLPTLWLRQPSPVVPVCISRLRGEHHDMTFFEPLDWEGLRENCADNDEFIYQATLSIHAQVELMISRSPQEYFWMHDRWKGQSV